MSTIGSCCRRFGQAFATKAQSAIQDMSDQHDMCVVCQYPMDVQSSVVALPCGHEFHGSCIVPHLYASTRCPICRNDPNEDGAGWSEDEDVDERPDYVPFCQAIQKAKEDKKPSKVIARMFATLRAHENDRTEARKKLRELQAKMAPHEDALDKRIETYANKAQDAHDKRHKTTLDAKSDARKAIAKSHTRCRAARLRIAVKYGYVRPSRRGHVRPSRRGQSRRTR